MIFFGVEQSFTARIAEANTRTIGLKLDMLGFRRE